MSLHFMRPNTCCPAKRRLLVCFIGLAVLAFAFALVVSRYGRETNAPSIVVLATWYSNGEQRVTFRPEPPSAEIIEAEVVSRPNERNAKPPTFRSMGYVIAVPDRRDTNSSLRFVSIPKYLGPGSRRYPGNYTVAYTPTEQGERVRVEVALDQSGFRDCLLRLRNCWYYKSLAMLKTDSHGDPTFVTIEPITNTVLGTP